MNNLYDLFHIIPVNDNCSFVYKDKDGSYKTKSKSELNDFIDGNKLIFNSEKQAQNYINRYLDTNNYKVGPFAGNKTLYDEVMKDTSVSLVDGHSES